MKAFLRQSARLLVLLVVSTLALQLYFLLRVALMAVVDPQSTTFQRSEAWRLLGRDKGAGWSQAFVPYDAISGSLKRAVVASEDAGFTEHGGVEWDAIRKASEKNQRAESLAGRIDARLGRLAGNGRAPTPPKVVGGSTITQQLAKNLFLSPERTILRKAQELVITFMLEGLLGKRRIFEIYLNSVEWGEGVFGAQAAARYYFHVPASQLAPWQAARLAVMLPSPKRFERRIGSSYLVARGATVAARMGAVDVP